jgi:steroid 5-alpha reductase family enzyme
VPGAHALGVALAAIAALAFAGWVASVILKNVAIVDGLWSIFFLVAAGAFAATGGGGGARATLVLALTALWALRLAGHIAWRSRGAPEDRRYRAIRAAHGPGFAWKSAYVVFGLQGLLAWLVGFPLFAAIASSAPLGAVDLTGVALWATGFAFETVGDAQLARFRADPANAGRVMDHGLWRYTRHPNYFGEALVWWGFWLVAVAAGGWWTVFAPALMTFLLLRVSGVRLLERDIGERRPAYRDYALRTNAFFPGPPKAP